MVQVGIIMGSKSDLPVMQDAIDILKDFNIEHEVDIVSAHRLSLIHISEPTRPY